MNFFILRRLAFSQRNQPFNPLIWPSLLATISYGLAFTFLRWTPGVGESSLYTAMNTVGPHIPLVWGIVACITIIMGLTFLLFNIPPAGKISGLIGFMLWVAASFCWLLTGGWLLVFAIGIPNMWFWGWQYLSLSKFRKEDADDKATMAAYDAGEYDDDNGGKELRETNRGMDLQSSGSYDNPDDGGDTSRHLDSDKPI